MTDWLSQCAERVLIIDGAMGTQLQARGLPPGECPEKWARDNALQLSAVHAAYVDAGADLIMTFTFGGSSIKLAKAGLDGETEAINWTLARVARDAAPNAVLLGGLGPTGALIAPLGDTSADEVRAAFLRQTAGLADVVDGFIIETMSDLDETILALEACKQAAPSKPVLASLTYELDHDGQGYHTFMGIVPEVAAKRLEEAGADAIGTNCGNGIDHMIGIVERLASSTRRPVFAEPNAGLPKLIGGQTVFDESSESMAGKVGQLIDAGARIIGGCCGTTPQHIAAMKAVVEER